MKTPPFFFHSFILFFLKNIYTYSGVETGVRRYNTVYTFLVPPAAPNCEQIPPPSPATHSCRANTAHCRPFPFHPHLLSFTQPTLSQHISLSSPPLPFFAPSLLRPPCLAYTHTRHTLTQIHPFQQLKSFLPATKSQLSEQRKKKTKKKKQKRKRKKHRDKKKSHPPISGIWPQRSLSIPPLAKCS